MAQHSIIVGVDGSKAAKDAVLWAVGAMRDGDILRLISVSAEADATARHDALVLDPMREAAYSAGAALDRVFTHIVPRNGNTGAHLVACAGQDEVKLIVLGSRGLGAFKQAIMSLLGMGSVSSYVLEHSPVPTAIVRYGAVLDTGSKPQLDIREPRKMCMALDGSPSAVYALEWALANLMQLDKDELHLISVLIMAKHEKTGLGWAAQEAVFAFEPQDLEIPDGPSTPIVGYANKEQAANKVASEIVKEASEKAVQAGMPKMRIKTAVLDPVKECGGSLVGTIVRYCTASKVYALCMGHRSRRSRLMAAGIGSAAHKVAEEAPCPVIIVRATEQP